MIVHKIESRKVAKPGLSTDNPCAGASLVLVSESRPKPESASLLTKAGRLRKELTAWLKKGAPIAPREVRAQRLAICEACSYYKADGNFGLGECRFPSCNCSRVKLALGNARCPHNPPKWNAVA